MANSAPSSSKRHKLKRKPGRNGIDRLTNLPEHILLHILSFLPTETVATTCVLSKTWQFLWTLVPNLDFDDSRTHLITGKHRCISFKKFVNKVLLRRREPFIRRFRLKCNSYCPSDSVDSWVCFAIAHNVQELDLDLGHEFKFRCTQQSCKTLVALKLSSVVLDRRLGQVSFPILKIFHLDMTFYQRHKEIKFLPSGFPVLEELVFKKSTYNISNIEICLPKLRSLAITLSFNDGHQGLVLRIDCPALTHLVVSDRHSREYRLENPLCLVEANIDYGRLSVMHLSIIHRDEAKLDCARSLINVLKGISNVRILRLSHNTMKGIELYLASSYSLFRLDEIPVFHNLVQVEFPFVGRSWEIIILMLQKFENLKLLTLCYKGNNLEGGGQGIGRRRVDHMKELIKQTHVPNCLTSHLTTLCFRKFKGSDDEMEVTRYILKNSLVLENMTIFSSYLLSSMDGPRIRRELCKSPTASEGCRFEFRPDEGDKAS